jgi:cytochrome c-type biogenesis protein CcmH
MGWIMLGLVGAVAFGLLALFGVPRTLWSFGAAALMLGATGYALQARPGLAGAPIASKGIVVDDEGIARMRELRGAMFGRFTALDTAFFPADALIRSGNPDSAARIMLGAVRQQPQNAALWTWLGMTLIEADQGTMSPAAALAFRRATALAPKHPGPYFFFGMAQARAGTAQAAIPLLRRAYALTPERASYRADIARALIQIEMLAEMSARATRAPAQ